MNQKPSYAQNVARVYGAQHRVLQQCYAQPSALPGFVDRQTAQNGYRHGIWHIAADRGRRIVQCQRTGGKTVITDHLGAFGDNIGARRAANLVRACAPLEPVIQAIDSTGKIIQPMFRR